MRSIPPLWVGRLARLPAAAAPREAIVSRRPIFGDLDDRLAGSAPVGGKRSSFAQRAYWLDDRLQASVLSR
jgi:hypothetical protein